MKSWYCVTCERLTAVMAIEDEIVVDASLALQEFVGQPSQDLENWVQNSGGKISELENNPEEATDEVEEWFRAVQLAGRGFIDGTNRPSRCLLFHNRTTASKDHIHCLYPKCKNLRRDGDVLCEEHVIKIRYHKERV